MENKKVLHRIENSVGIITINNPEALNALDIETLTELDHVLDILLEEPAVKALIITGAGRAFIAGADISAMAGMNPQEAKDFSVQGSELFLKIENFKTPVIAAVNGFALGGGCELALACDIRIASENAKFGQPEVSLGIIPGFSGTIRLPVVVGIAAAKELIFTGKIIDSGTALNIGLVNQVVPQDSLMQEAMETAIRIGKNSPYAVSISKQAINLFQKTSCLEAAKLENHLFSLCFSNKEQKEGMQAFIEKRKPSFDN